MNQLEIIPLRCIYRLQGNRKITSATFHTVDGKLIDESIEKEPTVGNFPAKLIWMRVILSPAGDESVAFQKLYQDEGLHPHWQPLSVAPAPSDQIPIILFAVHSAE